MKLSLAWIFDHIDANWKEQNIDNLVALFNKRTAEIEDFYRLSYDLNNFFIGIQTKNTATSITITIPELSHDIELPLRSTTIDMIPTTTTVLYFMVKKEGNSFKWATLTDFGVEKEGLIPALDVPSEALTGGWRTIFEAEDVILEVDNKSITHRPDMWGHRGFAREIAAFLHLQLHPKQRFLKELPVQTFTNESQTTASTPFNIKNQAQQACSRFAGFYISSLENKPTPLWLASRLLKVGSRPINALVDLANYVMLDWAQPLHAYDADKISEQTIIIRMAHDQEKLTLLDSTECSLTKNDLVIADTKKALCLAGVMGGLNSSLAAPTKSLFLEGATFDAGHIRRSAQRYKMRTDASARFEKTLDPNQVIDAIKRFIKLIDDNNLRTHYAQEIISVGTDAATQVIEVSHEFLERRAGCSFTEDDIIQLLSRLEFKVLKSFNVDQKVIYLITIPSFRASKDIKIKEDIVEEVVRCFGFENITPQFPTITRTPFDLSKVKRLSTIKHFCASAASMTEQQNYSMDDEQFIKKLGINPERAITIVNPVSENYMHMISSLVPGLLKNITDNHIYQDALSFFECARIWKKQKNEPVEQQAIAGIFFKKRTAVDFYQCKQHLTNLFATLGFDRHAITWHKADKQPAAWYRPYQTAILMYKQQLIGVAGKADPILLNKLDIDVPCDAFIFELDGNFLLTEQHATKMYQPISKFQENYFDVSLFVPRKLETALLEQCIQTSNPLIKSVDLIDIFEREAEPQETTDVRALTFRVWLGLAEKTLEKSDIDMVRQHVVAVLEKLGARVRM